MTLVTSALEARILEWTKKPPGDGSTHWRTRRLAKRLGVNHMVVARVGQKHCRQPYRIKRYLASDDPAFETKEAGIIGLYLHPAQHAAVLCADEETALVRHGTLSLFAALEIQSGLVFGKTAERHTSQAFVAFLADLLAHVSRNRELHMILENLSAHKTKRVAEFLAEHPRVHLHFTPTYARWLNHVELWFSNIERDLIHRGVFTLVDDLARRIVRYLRLHNSDSQPIRWRYNDPNRRIRAA